MVEHVERGATKKYRLPTARNALPVKRSGRTRKMPRRQGLPIKYTPNPAGRTFYKKEAARRKKRVARKLKDEAGDSEDKMEVDPAVKHDESLSEPVLGPGTVKDAPDEPAPASSSAPTREDTLLSDSVNVGTVESPWIVRRSQAKILKEYFEHLGVVLDS
ncbi:uncharacterized protein ARMOST_06503 [Armillaria ostoyae]|uniref:Uncharacterized protein n=1 Tax=Armillaria ostoyae TaxID=47428 RepID=A0A284R363_ARMOS|nr:uncharacterized protein ARMOST_06503 [Armillaria ostoyae]